MTIRAAEIADADAVARLHTRSWQSAYRGILSDDFLQGPLAENRRMLWRARLSESVSGDQFVLVDEQEGAIRGFACAFLRADPEWDCLLDNLHVLPDLKGRGLGRHLMGAVARRVLHANSAGRLHLWAYELNLGARRFYERLGGAITARVTEPAPDGSEVNALRYCWSDLSGLAAEGET
ncbi:MAG TPA: GNAT family N-acetyltransferase [Steroidobacteraceae bacterium]|jgi:GNAT superfamily N-acetyltransferase|nr:GNAT family N-acetyltransferase [Steroidobacteraceae bacterium]